MNADHQSGDQLYVSAKKSIRSLAIHKSSTSYLYILLWIRIHVHRPHIYSTPEFSFSLVLITNENVKM